jgi:hypothetical protein
MNNKYGGSLKYLNGCSKGDARKDKLKCIPLYNQIDSKINIITKDYFYIHFDDINSPTFILDDTFNLIKYTDHTIPFEQYTLEKLREFITLKLNFNNKKIPVYYLFIDNYDVFNIYLSSSDKNISNIFRTTKVEYNNNYFNSFIGMSVVFNIFNLAFITNTFIDIYYLFFEIFIILENNNDIQKIENIVKMKLNSLYGDTLDKKNGLINLYDIYRYKYLISLCSIESRNILLNNNDCNNIGEIKNCNTAQICQIETEINRENDSDTNKKYTNIINILTKEIIKLANYLYTFSIDIDFIDYKYLFLMSILSYRIKNPYIVGSWGFSISKTITQIKSIIINELDFDNETILTFFKDSPFPILYEYLLVTYNNQTYGNCMENTIFQLLKVIFWDFNNKIYKINKITQCINDLHIDKIKYFFNNINNERTQTFTYNWVEFISQFSGYDFIRDNCELNPTLANLYIAFENIFNIKNNMDGKFLSDIFKCTNNDMKIFIKQTKNDDNIIFKNNYGNINLELLHKKHGSFKESLSSANILNYIHKNSFHSIKLRVINGISPAFYANIIEYMMLKIFFTDKTNDIFKNYFAKYYFAENNKLNILIRTLFNDIQDKYLLREIEIQIQINKNIIDNDKLDIDSLLDIDSMSDYNISILTNINKIIFDDYKLKCINQIQNYSLLSVIEQKKLIDIIYKFISYFKKNISFDISFLQIIKNNDDILTKLLTIDYFNLLFFISESSIDFIKLFINNYFFLIKSIDWYGIFYDIKSTNFWIEIAKNNKILLTWNEHIWNNAMKNIKIHQFWIEIAKNNELLLTWDNNTWNNAMKNIKIHQFWIEIAKNNELLLKIFTYSNSKMHYIENLFTYSNSKMYNIDNIDNIKDFWINIAKNNDLLSKFNNELWIEIIRNIKSHEFWIEISHNNEILLKFNYHIWDLIITYVKLDKFWIELSKNNEILLKFNNQLWILIIKNIKSDEFWKNISHNNEILLKFDYRIWELIMINVKSVIFWVEIAHNNEIVLQWTDNIINYAITHIKIIQFWDEILLNKQITNPLLLCHAKQFITDYEANKYKSYEYDNFYKKYLKYKKKYLLLQSNLLN